MLINVKRSTPEKSKIQNGRYHLSIYTTNLEIWVRIFGCVVFNLYQKIVLVFEKISKNGDFSTT